AHAWQQAPDSGEFDVAPPVDAVRTLTLDQMEVPDGVLVAHQSTVMPRRAHAWPAYEPPGSDSTPVWRRPWVIVAFVAVLFGIGWLVGHSQAPDNDVHATPITRLLRTVGLGGARFSVGVESDPPGALI